MNCGDARNAKDNVGERSPDSVIASIALIGLAALAALAGERPTEVEPITVNLPW